MAWFVVGAGYSAAMNRLMCTLAILFLALALVAMPASGVYAEPLAQGEEATEQTAVEAPAAPADPLDDPQVAAEFEATTEQDEDKQRKLAARYARIPALSQVRPEVTAGVVTLRGAVTDEARRQIAEQLARALEGVIAVDNRLQMETALDRRLAPVLEEGMEQGRRLIESLPLIGLALLIVYLFHTFGRWLAHRRWLFRRAGKNPFLADLMRQVLSLAITIVGALIALDLLGATALVGAVLGAAGIVGLAVGFAFKDLVENYIAGILLSLRQPFAPNDHVVIDSHEGRVAALTSRATILITLDGNHLRLPNALVFKGVILNYSRNPTRRFQFDAGVSNDADLEKARALAIEALRETTGVIERPAPNALLRALADSNVTMRCTGWVDQRSASFGQVQSAAIAAVKSRLEAAGIELPEPIHRVQLLQLDAPVADQRPVREPPSPAAPAAIPSLEEGVERQIEAQVEAEAKAQAEHNLLDPAAARE